MTTRVLPVEEWGRLEGTDLGAALAKMPPEALTVLVAEDAAGAVVGCWALVAFAHVEGLWVAPEHRKRGRVLVRLWEAMCALGRSRGLESVYTGALSDDVGRLLASRQAVPLPRMFALPLRSLRG